MCHARITTKQKLKSREPVDEISAKALQARHARDLHAMRKEGRICLKHMKEESKRICTDPTCDHNKDTLALSGCCKKSVPRPCGCAECKPVECDNKECGMKCREGYARYFEAAHTGQRKTKGAAHFKSIAGEIKTSS